MFITGKSNQTNQQLLQHLLFTPLQFPPISPSHCTGKKIKCMNNYRYKHLRAMWRLFSSSFYILLNISASWNSFLNRFSLGGCYFTSDTVTRTLLWSFLFGSSHPPPAVMRSLPQQHFLLKLFIVYLCSSICIFDVFLISCSSSKPLWLYLRH